MCSYPLFSFKLEHPSHWPRWIPLNVAVPSALGWWWHMCADCAVVSPVHSHSPFPFASSIEITIIHGKWGTTTEGLVLHGFFFSFLFIFTSTPQVRG
jgi:hypothetical protein